MKYKLIMNDEGPLHPAATVKYRTTVEARRLCLIAEARQYARNAHKP
jgi:hypothetical protein